MKKIKCKNIVVGAGLTGATIAERIATQLGEPVTIIDRRRHVGGNVADIKHMANPYLQVYGAHIFHTNNEKVWHYLSQFTEWKEYLHEVVAVVGEELVDMPISYNSMMHFVGLGECVKYAVALKDAFPDAQAVPLRSIEAAAGRLCGTEQGELLGAFYSIIADNIFRGYTKKQWGTYAQELDDSVWGRVPVRVHRGPSYFTDKYQGLPKRGFSRMVKNMLSHRLIKLEYGVDWKEACKGAEYERLFYTGGIDEFFDCDLGRLPYRSLKFKFESCSHSEMQACAVYNYPSEKVDYTRRIDFGHFEKSNMPFFWRAYEFPQDYKPGENEPFYPIPTEDSRKLYEAYRRRASGLPNVHFLGRLGAYKYLDMDMAVGDALDYFENNINPKK